MVMTIVCVDESPIALASMWRHILKIIPGAKVHCCRSAIKAREYVNKYECGILITDIDLGQGKDDGIRLAEEIKQMYPQVNIIFATAAPEREYASRILKMRISGFLTKPFTADELREELGNLRYA